ncbi:MAG: SUMF1/EgtB/PvdO family nonheme iron enzyme [Kiritimatiellia bacterium]|jgi:formylglycine-generating enzyme required for sulfatase activity|nr:SUMF1/EgtB/PvdO family nonheme iron enzyme [Kiritimatiellia bacterium]
MKAQTRILATAALLHVCVLLAPAADDPAALRNLKSPERTVPGIELKLKRIPAGTFLMGSPETEPDRREDEQQHKVTISHPFYMGIYEVTQKQYYDIMLPDYEHDSWQYARGPLHDGLALFYRSRSGRSNYESGRLNLRHPMECVSWQRAMEFCARITDIEGKAGRLPKGYVYRLPTEAEWEYACRAGSTGSYNVKYDGEEKADLKSPRYLKSFANVGAGKAMDVGERRPNAWGLYDMHGNVYEWCLDWYGPYATGKTTDSTGSSQVDPTGPAEGKKRVARGGCFNGPAPHSPPGVIAGSDSFESMGPFLRSAGRYRFYPEANFYAILGFRVVLGTAEPDERARRPKNE